MFLDATINKSNLINIKKNIKKYNSKPNKIQIIAVTKNFSYCAIQSANENKIQIVGENKVQETIEKIKNRKLPTNIEIHLIGHLQSNKAKKAVNIYSTIQSVDSIQIAEKINFYAKKNKKKQKIFLQINIAKQKTQFGFDQENIYNAAETIKKLKNIQIEGVMVIAPNTKNKPTINQAFKKAKEIKNKIQKNIVSTCRFLSAGMSNDYDIALQNGATHLRLGTILYNKIEQK